MEIISHSPKPMRKLIVKEVKDTFNFYEAMKKLLDGKKIKSEGWWNEAVYAYFNKEEILCIKRPNREDQQWIIRKIDLEVDDYIEVTNEK